jgi:hypothetical protein
MGSSSSIIIIALLFLIAILWLETCLWQYPTGSFANYNLAGLTSSTQTIQSVTDASNQPELQFPSK